MNKWNEIRTAYKLAQYQTLSATAEDMGVHRSTVMRHIDALEAELGVVLFQRNDKGYIPTEAGLEIMRLGEVTENHFSQLTLQIQSREQALAGKLTITAVSDVASALMPYIKEYQASYPLMRVDFVGDIRNYNLEYAEADIAIRSGAKPSTPDNIVFPMADIEIVLCAHQSYIDTMGEVTESSLSQHRFIALKERPKQLLWNEWIYEHIPEQNIVFLCSSMQVGVRALEAGCGISAMPKVIVEESADLVIVSPSLSWTFPLWALVHRDMFHLSKIKAFIDILKRDKDKPLRFKL